MRDEVDRSDVSSLDLRLVRMHSKTESSLAQSVTSESNSENNYSLCDSYDAEVAYKHTPETSKYAQALNKKGK